MTEVLHAFRPTAATAVASAQPAPQRPPALTQAAFHQVLDRVKLAPTAPGSAPAAVHHAVLRVPAPPAGRVPQTSLDALGEAMTLEGVPQSWQPALAFIMDRESGGRVGAHSPIHSARGLYQLTAASYHYNPRGAASFGHAVEEARGGIRYIRARYGTADKAAAHWNQHHWY